MNWKKSVGFGLLLWIIMFVIASVFVILNWLEASWGSLVLGIIGGGVALILAKYVRPSSPKMALSCGLTWVVVALILDLAVTKQFNPGFFGGWEIWFGYALILLAPLLKVSRTTVQGPA